MFIKVKGCGHDPNKADDTTLVLLPNRELVYPQKYYFFCPKCKKTFTFVKENGFFNEKGAD